MDKNVLVFLVLALATLIAAVKVVTSANVMRSALWLAGSFVSIAGVYFLLSAELLGTAQLLIYAGAIATLIVFAIMLSDAQSSNPSIRLPNHKLSPLALGISIVLVGSLVQTLLSVDWGSAGTSYTKPDSLHELGKILFTKLAVPNEVASIILLVALVGSIALSMKEGNN